MEPHTVEFEPGIGVAGAMLPAKAALCEAAVIYTDETAVSSEKVPAGTMALESARPPLVSSIQFKVAAFLRGEAARLFFPEPGQPCIQT